MMSSYIIYLLENTAWLLTIETYSWRIWEQSSYIELALRVVGLFNPWYYQEWFQNMEPEVNHEFCYVKLAHKKDSNRNKRELD